MAAPMKWIAAKSALWLVCLAPALRLGWGILHPDSNLLGVNPVRWDQSHERALPSFFATRKTEMFNGYADQVASMYAGMDLRKWY